MSEADKGKVAPKEQNRTKGRRPQELPSISIWQRILFGPYIVVASVVILGLAIGLPAYFSQRHDSSPAPSPPAVQPAPAQPAQVARIDGPAPSFSLQDPYGKTYTLTPGDGRAHLLVFYMGNF